MPNVTFYVVDNLVPSSLLESVNVSLFSQDGASFITQGLTDSNGALTIPSQGVGTYWLRLFKQGYSFKSKLLIEVVEGVENVWEITGNDLTELPPSSADGICRVSGFLVDLSGAPTSVPTLQFMALGTKRVIGDRIIATEKIEVSPNKDGYAEVELLQDVIYDCTLSAYGDEVFQVRVPSEQACNLTELLFPRGGSVSVQTSIIAAVDEEVTVDAEFKSGSLLKLSSSTDIETYTVGSLFEVETSPSENIAVTLSNENITVKASKAGNYSINLYSKDPNGYRIGDPVLLKTISVTVS